MPDLRERIRAIVAPLPDGAAVTLPADVLRAWLAEEPVQPDPIGDLTVEQAAAEVGKAPSTVRTWLTSSGGIPGAYKLHGREWRIPGPALRNYLRRGGRREAPGPQPSWDEV